MRRSSKITIPEGKRLEEVAIIVAEQTNISADAFLQMAQTGWQGTDWPQTYGFLAQIPVTATLEGLLFPDTYRLPSDATAYDLIDRMLANFERQVTPEMQQQFVARGLSFYEGITLAAIVEREAVIDAERPVIAGVFYNRLRDGWPLSSCPTVQYALGYRPDEEDWWKSPALLRRSGGRVAVQYLSQPGPAAGSHRQPRPALHRSRGESRRNDLLFLYGGLHQERRQPFLRGDGGGALAEFQRLRWGDYVTVDRGPIRSMKCNAALL